MAAQAERVCAVCAKPIDVPRQDATTQDTLCATCMQLRRRSRAYDQRLDADINAPKVDRPDYDLHAPGAM